MQRGKINLTYQEAMEILDHIVGITLEAYNKDLREEFRHGSMSRSTQVGYDAWKYLFDKGLIKIGNDNEQQKLDV